MQVVFDSKADKEFLKLNEKQQVGARKYLKLFRESGFSLNQNYLKKISRDLWELRPGKVRLFLLRHFDKYVVLHVMVKKSQKITKKTNNLLSKRKQEYK